MNVKISTLRFGTAKRESEKYKARDGEIKVKTTAQYCTHVRRRYSTVYEMIFFLRRGRYFLSLSPTDIYASTEERPLIKRKH